MCGLSPPTFQPDYSLWLQFCDIIPKRLKEPEEPRWERQRSFKTVVDIETQIVDEIGYGPGGDNDRDPHEVQENAFTACKNKDVYAFSMITETLYNEFMRIKIEVYDEWRMHLEKKGDCDSYEKCPVEERRASEEVWGKIEWKFMALRAAEDNYEE